MKIIMDEPIDIIYEQWLKELQEYYDESDITEVVKHCIAMQHNIIPTKISR